MQVNVSMPDENQPPFERKKPLLAEKEGEHIPEALTTLLGEIQSTGKLPSSKTFVLTCVTDQISKQLMASLKVLAVRDDCPAPLKEEIIQFTGRYEQLTARAPAEHGLEPQQLLKLAYFIAITLPSLAGQGTVYFKKSVHEQARSVGYDPSTKEVFVFSKRHVDILDVSGDSKRINSALRLPLVELSHEAELIAQSAPIQDVKVLISYGFDNPLSRDAQIHRELNGLPGIWKLHSVLEYTHEKMQIPTIAIFLAKARGNLESLEQPIPLETLQVLAKALLLGVQSMHQKGYIHGDLRLKNCLRGDTYGIIDFETAFRPGKDKDPGKIIDNGIYGSIHRTAPELYGTRNFSGDFFKLDTWALGCMLYRLRFGSNEPPWTSSMETHVEHDVSLPEKRAKLNKSIHDAIEVPLAAIDAKELDAKESLTPQERFDRLIYNLLRLNPASRYDAQTALNTLPQ